MPAARKTFILVSKCVCCAACCFHAGLCVKTNVCHRQEAQEASLCFHWLLATKGSQVCNRATRNKEGRVRHLINQNRVKTELKWQTDSLTEEVLILTNEGVWVSSYCWMVTSVSGTLTDSWSLPWSPVQSYRRHSELLSSCWVESVPPCFCFKYIVNILHKKLKTIIPTANMQTVLCILDDDLDTYHHRHLVEKICTLRDVLHHGSRSDELESWEVRLLPLGWACRCILDRNTQVWQAVLSSFLC